VKMRKTASLVVWALILLFGSTSLMRAQVRDESRSTGFWGSAGAGYIHAMGGITTVWTDGGEVELSGIYHFKRHFGVEGTGICGFTGMTDAMKLPVLVEDSYGNVSTETPTGGLYLAFLLGPSAIWSIRSSPGRALLFNLGCGGFRQGEMETGIDAEGYEARWTFGWGVYASAGVHFQKDFSDLSWGIQLRYLYSMANVDDFNSPNPPATTDDQRLMIVVDIRGKV